MRIIDNIRAFVATLLVLLLMYSLGVETAAIIHDVQLPEQFLRAQIVLILTYILWYLIDTYILGELRE